LRRHYKRGGRAKQSQFQASGNPEQSTHRRNALYGLGLIRARYGLCRPERSEGSGYRKRGLSHSRPRSFPPLRSVQDDKSERKNLSESVLRRHYERGRRNKQTQFALGQRTGKCCRECGLRELRAKNVSAKTKPISGESFKLKVSSVKCEGPGIGPVLWTSHSTLQTLPNCHWRPDVERSRIASKDFLRSFDM
jgi:hypothetical protein